MKDKKVSAFPVSSSMNIKPTSVQSDATLTTTGKGVKIGVIDTGVDYLHEALGGRFLVRGSKSPAVTIL